MPWSAAVGALVSTVAGSMLSDSGGGGGGGTAGGNAPPVYIPKNQQGVDDDFLANKDQYLAQLRGMQNTTSPYAYQALTDQFNNPYNQQALSDLPAIRDAYQRNATNATDLGRDLTWMAKDQEAYTQTQRALSNQQLLHGQQVNQLYNNGMAPMQEGVAGMRGLADQTKTNYNDLMAYQKGQLGNIQASQNNLYGSGNSVLNTAFDPQQALYNRTQQQLTEQNRAAQSARGIQMTPYGAALENSANQNFNIDWQNQQLGRQSQGLQAAQGAYGTAQGMGNSYTSTQAGLQAGLNEQYSGLQNSANQQYSNYLGAMSQNSLANSALGLQFGQADIARAQGVMGLQQGALNIGDQAARSLSQAGLNGLNLNQQIYGNQNTALNNYLGANQSYMQGLNQLQSNDLGYMNFGQGAQNLGWQQDMYNNNQNQKAIAQIAGPIGNAVKNKWSDWTSGWGGYDSTNDLNSWADSQSGYLDPGYDGP